MSEYRALSSDVMENASKDEEDSKVDFIFRDREEGVMVGSPDKPDESAGGSIPSNRGNPLADNLAKQGQ